MPRPLDLLEGSTRAKDWGIAVVRIVVGFTFLMHGYQKAFMFGLDGVSESFARMGAPLPEVSGPLVAFVELIGGASLLVGLLTRLVAIPLAVDMLTAIVVVHAPNGFFAPMGVELVLLLLAGAVGAILAGPGALSLDRLILGSRVPKTSYL